MWDGRSLTEERQAYHIHCENLRSTLARLVGTQFEIIVDLVLRDEVELQETLRVLSERPVYLIGVRAPLEVLEERESRREDRGTGMAREQSRNPAFDRDYDVVIDTSSHTPETGASAIRSFVREHPRLGGARANDV
jgi:chloramphenicol 3-O phosphotransferase